MTSGWLQDDDNSGLDRDDITLTHAVSTEVLSLSKYARPINTVDLRSPSARQAQGYGAGSTKCHHALTAQIKNSTLPCGPVIGLVVNPFTVQPAFVSQSRTSSQTRS